MGLFTRSHRIPPATPAYNASKPMIIPMTSSAQLYLHECKCVAVAESVRSSSVAVVSGIYYNYHWWLQAYPTLMSHENGSQ